MLCRMADIPPERSFIVLYVPHLQLPLAQALTGTRTLTPCLQSEHASLKGAWQIFQLGPLVQAQRGRSMDWDLALALVHMMYAPRPLLCIQQALGACLVLRDVLDRV